MKNDALSERQGRKKRKHQLVASEDGLCSECLRDYDWCCCQD